MNHPASRFRPAAVSLVFSLLAGGASLVTSCAESSAPPDTCTAALTSCSGACVDTQTDPRHCGSCEVQCAPGQLCAGGDCGCAAGLTDCSGACVNLQTDVDHCGDCAVECSSSQVCVDGTCGCESDRTDCGGTCVNMQVDTRHCGACDVACAPGAFCRDGECTCVTGPFEDIGSSFPQTLSGTTVGGGANYGLSCVAAGSTEQVFLFHADVAGTYTFDTFGSSFDTALGVIRADSCEELACNDDSQGIQSKVSTVLDAGESALIVVTGFNGAQGDFVLNLIQAAPPICPSGNVGPALPATATGNTAALGDAITPSCGTAGSPDASYTFTAPSTARYVFDTFGSEYNTILEVRDGDCSGRALACNDDSQGQQSRVTVNLNAGQTVVAVVDGFSGAGGPYSLNVSEWVPPPCPMLDLGSTSPQTVAGNTSGFDEYLTSPCSGGSAPEVSYSFTAPATGRYTFDTSGSSFDTAVHVHSGTCSGPVLGCNDNNAGLQSRVSVPINTGETVYVVIDGVFGSSGPYTLNVSSIIAPPCPSLDLGSTVPQTVTGTTSGLADFVGAPCGTAGGAEVAYSFTAPTDGIFVFDTFGSSFNTVLHVHDATCVGPSLGCNDNTAGIQSRVTAPLTAGQTVVVVVDGSGTAAGNYTLNVSQFTGAGTCANPIDLGSTVPVTRTGSTLLQPNSATPGCTASSGNDLVYQFTAPADGAYVIDTVGSTFDTVLHVRDGASCAGAELGCNDNTSGITSRVSVTLTAGQVITIVADSQPSASGNLTLRINPAP